MKLSNKKAIILQIKQIMIVNAIYKKTMLKNLLKSLNAILIKIQNYLTLNNFH